MSAYLKMFDVEECVSGQVSQQDTKSVTICNRGSTICEAVSGGLTGHS